MIVKVSDLSGDVRRVDFRESGTVINEMIAASPGWSDHRVEGDVTVVGEIYRHGGDDVTFVGTLAGTVMGSCPRCLEEFCWTLDRRFKFLIAPSAGENEEDDAGLAHYAGDEIDLGLLIREQVVLGLDESILCSEGCCGLCPGCGVNLNREACRCRDD